MASTRTRRAPAAAPETVPPLKASLMFGKTSFELRIATLEKERALSLADFDARIDELKQWAALCDSQSEAQA